MSDNNSPTVTHDLEQQIGRLEQMAEQIRMDLLRCGSALPQNALAGLAQLAGSLNRLNRQVARRSDEAQNLKALADIGQVVNSSLELEAVLRIVMDTIIRLSGAERGFLMLKESPNSPLAAVVARNWEQESLNESEMAVSRTVIQRVVNEGQPVITTNAQEDPRFGGQESVILHHMRSILCVPLKVKDVITGVIYTDNRIRTGIFSEVERDLLTSFGNQAAVAIENARLFESVRRTLAEVTELKNLMDNVFASIASGVLTADVQDRITLCNRAAGEILGRSQQELVGRPLREALPPLASELERHVSQVRQSEHNLVGLEVASNIPARGDVSLTLNLSPLKDAQQATQGVAIVLDDLTEKKRLEKLYNLFGRMVSPAVIQQIDLDNPQMGGRRDFITTLFADVRGFTTFSEAHSPEQLVSILNCYLAAAAKAVLAEEGTLDKFMGDAVMAVFNAPLPQADHTLRAVRAALGIRAALGELHCTLDERFRLQFGMGIHFGEAVLGLVGTEKAINYTAIGDSVNTAKRIQENAAGGQILISADAYARVAGEVLARPVEAVQAKGKRLPLEVYEIIALKS